MQRPKEQGGKKNSTWEMRQGITVIKDEKAEQRKTYSNLRHEIKKFYNEMHPALEEKDTKVVELEQKNAELLKHAAS